jgi:Metallo-beta-lactamase superfamily.
LYYEEFLKPRGGAGILDPLFMGMLPPLEGLYRDDIAPAEIFGQFQNNLSYRKIDKVDGVLLTHAHLDHSAHISFLREDIPVFSTAGTAFITKAIQDSGATDFDKQVCYYLTKRGDCMPRDMLAARIYFRSPKISIPKQLFQCIANTPNFT